MSRPDRLDLGLVMAVVAATGATAVAEGRPIIDWLFMSFVLSCLALVIRAAAATFRAAMVQRSRARALGGLDPHTAARRAVLAEGERLARELDACIRDALAAVRGEVETLRSEDPRQDLRPHARRIHAHARRATSELRRQLGLLRAEPEVGDFGTPAPLGTSMRPDVLLSLAVSTVAVVETALLAPTELGDAFTWWMVPATGLAAVTLIGRRPAPVLAASLASALFLLGTAVGAPVSSGAWMVATLGGLQWALAARGLRDPAAIGAATALTASVWWTRTVDDPNNASIAIVIMAVAWLGGLTVGRNRRWQAAASAQARKLEAELEEARIEAVHAERIQLARELHDVVSHAVGVIAMQAAAAEVSWPDSPGAALRALDAVDVTAQQALAELERVVPGAEPATPGTADDLTALVARIRATGTQVTLTSDGALEAAAAAVVYRIVQESLTNAVRHAPGAAVSVRVLADRDGTHVEVADDGPWPGPGHPRGYGLVGLTERVTLAGGTVTTGPGPGGAGFVVAAHLPRIRARSA